jgi:hypothetical protein
MPGTGQFVEPVQVEVTSNIGADVAIDGTAPLGADLRGLAIMGYFEAGNLLFVPRTNAAGELIVAVGGGGSTTDTDDNAVAAGQVLLLTIVENYIHNGATWIRQQGGADNAVATVPPQGSFIAGVARAVLPVYADGDVVVPNFDTSGRLMVNSDGVTDTDDDAIAAGQTTGLVIPLNYFFNEDSGEWNRWEGSADDNAIPAGEVYPIVTNFNYIYAGVVAGWIRHSGGTDGVTQADLLQGAYVGGVVTDPYDVFADGDTSLLHYDTAGRVLISNTQFQNVETTAALGGGASFSSPTRNYTHFETMGISVFVQRSVADTNVDVIIENSSDGGVTWREVDRVNLAVTAASPTATANRTYAVTRLDMRVRLVNNTANALLATELITMQKVIS